MGIRELVKGTLVRIEDRRYERRLRKRQTVYGDWAAALEAKPGAGETEVCACGHFAVFCAGDGRMAAGALQAMEAYLAAHPGVRILYGDEDVWEGGGKARRADRKLPWYKPDWSPDLLDSFFYFGSVTAVDRELLEEAGFRPEEFSVPVKDCGCVRQVTDFAAYERAVHAWVTLAGGYEKAASCVGHVERILFHGRNGAQQEGFLQPSPFLNSLREQRLQRLRSTPAAEEESAPLLSVVIPSKDHPQDLEACIKGCMLAAESPDGRPPVSFEIILVDNGSTGENRERIETMAGRLSGPEKGGCEIRYLYDPGVFNFSLMCNQGAARARGRLLLFLNDDVTLSQAGTFEEMAALAIREGTGAVGLKLYYPDSVRIQHAGITNLPAGPVDMLRFLQDNRCYYYGANRGNRNVLAVTAACLMTDREKFWEAGGFSEELRVAFNDVDLCFRLYEAGYRNVCVNDFHGCHHESLSRGDDESGENLRRLGRERERLYACHPHLEGVDPYYAPGLNREGLFTTGIRPAYLTAGNGVQRLQGRRNPVSLAGYRRDPCLTLCVEEICGDRVRGYGLVLGDDNACYKRWLLLGEIPETESADFQTPGKIHALKLEGMYRPDLEENMPDQRNVALCGFHVEIGDRAVPAGRYRLGMAARNRAGGVRLVNWSSRFMQLGPHRSNDCS